MGVYLVMIDFGGGVVPGEYSVLRAQPSKCNEVLRLGNVDWLLVHTRRHANHNPAFVAERHNVYGFLHSPVISSAVLRHADHSGRHPPFLRIGFFSLLGLWELCETEVGCKFGNDSEF